MTSEEKQARYEKSPEYKAKLIAEQEEKDKQDKEALARQKTRPTVDPDCDKCDGNGHYTDYCDLCKNERTIPMFNPEWSTEKAYSAYGKWTNTNCPVCMKGCYTSSQIQARKKSFYHVCDKCKGTGKAGGARKW